MLKDSNFWSLRSSLLEKWLKERLSAASSMFTQYCWRYCAIADRVNDRGFLSSRAGTRLERSRETRAEDSAALADTYARVPRMEMETRTSPRLVPSVSLMLLPASVLS